MWQLFWYNYIIYRHSVLCQPSNLIGLRIRAGDIFFFFFFNNSLPKNIHKNKNFTNGWTKSINRFKKIRTFIVKLYVLIIHNSFFFFFPISFCLLQHPIWWSANWPQISAVLQVILFQLGQNVFAIGVFTQSCDVGSNLQEETCYLFLPPHKL